MTVIYILNDVLKYFILIIAFAWSLEVFGIDIKAIILSLGIIGIAIGIASKDIVSNFLSGLFVLSDKSIRIGDIISVDNKKELLKNWFKNYNYYKSRKTYNNNTKLSTECKTIQKIAFRRL